MKKQVGLLILCNTLLAFFVLGQDQNFNKIAGLGFGTSIPKTDLEPSYKNPGVQASAFVQFNSRRWLNISFYFTAGEVQSENRDVRFFDQSQFQINDFANTQYQSIHVEPSIHFVNNERYSIYVAQGFGFMRFSVSDRDNQLLISQLNTRAEGEEYSNFTVVLPTSLNVNYFFPNQFGLHFRTGWMNAQTDYLDNISLFGNPDTRDALFFLQLSVLKKFNFNKSDHEE